MQKTKLIQAALALATAGALAIPARAAAPKALALEELPKAPAPSALPPMRPPAAGVPVYMSPLGFFASGHYSREFLESKTAFARAQAWWRVRAVDGRVGWTPAELLVTAGAPSLFGAFAPRVPLRAREAVVPRDGLPLRSAPLPDANVVAVLRAGAKLTRIGGAELRWGKALIASLSERPGTPAEVWWPMADGFAASGKKLEREAGERLSTSELFSRKLHDLISCPNAPGLQFASASGVFRTTDGKTWRQLPEFRESNFPLAAAKGGMIFVGPYASVDRGETFEQFVKWDEVVDAIKSAYGADPQRMNLLEVTPLDDRGERVRLALDVGFGEAAIAETWDRGRTWMAMKPVGYAGSKRKRLSPVSARASDEAAAGRSTAR